MAGALSYADMAVLMTAYRRPYYLAETLKSWRAAEGMTSLAEFRVAIDPSDRLQAVAETAGDFLGEQVNAIMQINQGRRGVSCNPVDSANELLEFQPGLRFLVFAEEDLVVSADVLAYLAWAGGRLEHDDRVLAVCCHPGQDGTDPSAARLEGRFSPWVWGTWTDRWKQIIEPTWDRNYTSGNGDKDWPQSGWDWNLNKRIIPRGGYLVCFPDLSRSQNIGMHEGVHADPMDFPGTVLASFRPAYDSRAYRLATD